ncbi:MULTISPECIES: hypothetical protein [Vibrio]|uniref:Uncharacterized protein n=1 Tax=Vibrio proteolyticus NBRC 13287 TaxID=1219065 RepID=U2ZH83_VIBPR|nr:MULTISPECIES: hypothetical protein [Vibrio]NAW55937.1 hypothetical protein [Vibrio sp. V36_P2S2PM302]NAX26513.1 hypothetical protein [Vibrio sp. V38_P2S17PM301]NAX29145.1 hypothetical protein [Vibrio sp. V37_P2S8PM304]GAD67051.1 hypothetical protein VPR01S_06_00680 [Vibrio proteolyticus NBRC 13287]
MKSINKLITITGIFSALAVVPAASAMQMDVQTLGSKAMITVTDNGQAVANQEIMVKNGNEYTVKTDEFGRASVWNQENHARTYTFMANDASGNTMTTKRRLPGDRQ